MRKTPLIAAALLVSSAAGAQVYESGCRGETLSELARCAAERAPAPAEEPEPEVGEVGEVAPLTPRRVQPRTFGGALQPTNQRREPPVVGRSPTPTRPTDALPSAPPAMVPLRGMSDDPYGAGRAELDRQRYLDPLGGTGVRDRTITGR